MPLRRCHQVLLAISYHNRPRSVLTMMLGERLLGDPAWRIALRPPPLDEAGQSRDDAVLVIARWIGCAEVIRP